MVRSWKTKEKNKATYGRLLRVCLKNGHESCADGIVKLMKEIEKKKQIQRGKYIITYMLYSCQIGILRMCQIYNTRVGQNDNVCLHV